MIEICCKNTKQALKLICECVECDDIEEVKRNRKLCPFERGCKGELIHYERIVCENCDYAEDYFQGWNE